MQIWGLAVLGFKIALAVLFVSVLFVAFLTWLIIRWRRTWP